MPHYLFVNKQTFEVHDVTMSYEQLKDGYSGEMRNEIGLWERIFTPPSVATETAAHHGDNAPPVIDKYVDYRI